MPELPDVELFKRKLDATAIGQTVNSVSVHDRRVLGVSPGTLRRHLESHRLERSARHGKYLFAELDDGQSLILHFGMTGRLNYEKDEGEPGRHDSVVLHLGNGCRLDYYSRRKIGKVTIAADRETFIRDKALGPDALTLDVGDFAGVLADKHAMLKPLLMDQHQIAGLGNVYTDEILFQARLHPRAQAADLDDKTARRLHGIMCKVLTEAVARNADPQSFPRTWLTPHRKSNARCPRCDTPLEIAQVGGRTTYWCPRRQRL